jgi:hypothetical protein
MKKEKLPTLQKLWLKHAVYGGDHYAAWFVVCDSFAGRKGVYTVYRISLTSNKQAHVIGRELDLVHAKKIVRQDMKAIRAFGS